MGLSRCTVLASLAVALLVILLAMPGQSASPLFDSTTMMPLSSVRAGMQGTCRTVFSGIEISEFNIEILGVLPKLRSGADVILARVLDGPIVENGTGVFSGMSGSPVYVDGRLVGAVALTWAFGKQPIAGITPIESMLQAFDKEDSTETEEAAAARARPDNSVTLAGQRLRGVEVVGATYGKPFVGEDILALRPVMTPMLCAGFSDATLKRLAGFFEERGMLAVAGPGNMRRKVDVELEPGAAVGIQLVSGDFDINGVGTVTYRDADRILAFGHPMMKLGRTQLPLMTAWVHHVVASLDLSFRMASGISPVGTLTEDSTWSIAGRVGDAPAMIPASFEIHDLDNNMKRTYEVQVCNDPTLRSLLILFCSLDALYAGYDANDEGTVAVSFTVQGDKGTSITRSDTFAYSADPTQTTVWEMLSAMTLLEMNRFKPQAVSSVKLIAKLKRESKTATIERAWTEEQVARAGEEVTIHVLIRPKGGELTERVVSVDMPLELPKGYLRLAVSSGGYGWLLRPTMRLLMPEFNDLQTVIDEYERAEQNTQLLTLAAMPTMGLRVGSVRLNSIPNSVLSILSSSTRTDIAMGYSELSVVQDTPYVLDGLFLLMLPTEDRRGEKAKVKVPLRGLLPGGALMGDYPGAESSGWGEMSWRGRVPAALWWARSAFAEGQVESPVFPPAATQLQPPDIPIPEHIKELLEKSGEPPDLEEPDDEEPEEEEDGEGKVIRGASLWLHNSAKDYKDGQLEGIGVRDDGVLFVSPQWQCGATAPGEILWSMAADAKGKVYVGEATGGRIYVYDGEELQPYFATEQASVSALLIGTDGKLYAGTCGAGKIFVVSGPDQGEVFCKLPDAYVWDLEPAPQGGLLAATGPHGVVYRVDEQGDYSVYADVPQSHVLCVAVRDGIVFAGTSMPGAVYQIGPERQIIGLLNTDDDDITDLVVSNGELYAAAASEGGKGKVHRIGTAGVAELVCKNDKSAVRALLAANGTVYAGTDSESVILALTASDHHSIIYRDEDADSILCLAADGKGRLFAGGINPGRMLIADTSSTQGATYTSAVLDAERVSQWGQVKWWAQGAGVDEIVGQCRSGNTSDYDEGSWSSWSREYPNGAQIDVPAARYLQYRLKLPAATGDEELQVQAIKLSYLPANQKPELEIKSPAAGAALRSEAKIKWSADDPDEDTVAATIYLREVGSEEWEKVAGPIQESSYELDTTERSDGSYELRITVTDEPSNPGAGREVSETVSGVRLDNTAPLIYLQPAVGEQEEAAVTVTGLARDDESGIDCVSWQVKDAEEWWAAQPGDGAYDEQVEGFTINASDLPEDAKEIVVRVWDQAGNSTDEEVRLPWVSEDELEEEGTGEVTQEEDEVEEDEDGDDELPDANSASDEAKG